MGHINPEDPEFQKMIQSEIESEATPKLAGKFRQDLAARNEFGVRYKLETVKAAIWNYIHETAAGYEKKFRKQSQVSENTTRIVKGDIAMAITASICANIDNDEFFKAGKKNSDEGEELQLQMVAQAIKEFLDHSKQDMEASVYKDEHREQRLKTIELISKLIE